MMVVATMGAIHLPEIQIVALSDLNPASYNPRQIDERSLQGLTHSLETWGLVEPIIYNKQTGNIVGGHQRYKVLQNAGIDEVQAIVVDLDLPQEKALNVSLNNMHLQGTWDVSSLEEVLESIQEEIDFGALNLDLLADEFNFEFSLPTESIEPEIFTDEDDVPEVDDDDIVIEEGDFIEMGSHRLLCGDSTVAADIAKLLGNDEVDLLLTDPPYNLNYDFNDNGMVQTGQRKARFGKIKNDCMDNESFDVFIEKVFSNALNVMKPGASFYITGGRESTQVFNRILSSQKSVHIAQWLIWVKENFNISRCSYHPKHEVITFGWKQGKSHQWNNDRSQVDVLEFSREIGTSVHPTQKPVSLLKYLIANSSVQNEVVLDLFGGSGSTLIACQLTGRKSRLMELDPKYCQVIVQRFLNSCQTEHDQIKINGKLVSWNQYYNSRGGDGKGI